MPESVSSKNWLKCVFQGQANLYFVGSHVIEMHINSYKNDLSQIKAWFITDPHLHSSNYYIPLYFYMVHNKEKCMYDFPEGPAGLK